MKIQISELVLTKAKEYFDKAIKVEFPKGAFIVDKSLVIDIDVKQKRRKQYLRYYPMLGPMFYEEEEEKESILKNPLSNYNLIVQVEAPVKDYDHSTRVGQVTISIQADSNEQFMVNKILVSKHFTKSDFEPNEEK